MPRLACSRIGDTSPAKIAMPVDARPRAASPRVMCSILMTSAPQSLRMADAAGHEGVVREVEDADALHRAVRAHADSSKKSVSVQKRQSAD